MNQRAGPMISTAGFAWSAALAGCAVLLSSVSAGLLTAYLAVLAAFLVFRLDLKTAGRSSLPGSVSAALASACFPVALLFRGESGLLWAGALAILLVGSSLLIFRPPEGAVAYLAGLIWSPLYIGFGLSYAVLVRQLGGGHKLLVSATMILLAYKASALVSFRLGLTSPGGRSGRIIQIVSVPLAGVAAAAAAAMVSLVILPGSYSAGPLAVVGLVVSLAALLGESFGRFATPEISERGLEIAPLDAWALALPAFFYSFRLYLT